MLLVCPISIVIALMATRSASGVAPLLDNLGEDGDVLNNQGVGS
jgi:hypothetical protein